MTLPTSLPTKANLAVQFLQKTFEDHLSARFCVLYFRFKVFKRYQVIINASCCHLLQKRFAFLCMFAISLYTLLSVTMRIMATCSDLFRRDWFSRQLLFIKRFGVVSL